MNSGGEWKMNSQSCEEGSPQEMQPEVETSGGTPSRAGGSKTPRYDIVIQVRKSALAKMAVASYEKTYPSTLKGSFTEQGIGLVEYNIQLDKPKTILNPTTPQETKRYDRAIKIENAANGVISLKDIEKSIRVKFNFYRVMTLDLSGGNLVLQFRKVGITDFSPSGQNLGREIEDRVRVTADKIIERQTKGKFQSIRLFPTKLPLRVAGTLLEIDLEIIKVIGEIIYACFINGTLGNINYSIDFTHGLDFSITVDGAKAQKIFKTIWDAGKIQTEYEKGGYKAKIIDIGISCESGFVKVKGKGKAWRKKFPGKHFPVPFKFEADVGLSINAETNRLEIKVIGKPKVKANKWIEWIIVYLFSCLGGWFGLAMAIVLSSILKKSIGNKIEEMELSFPVQIPVELLSIDVKLKEIEVFNDGTTNGIIIRGEINLQFGTEK